MIHNITCPYVVQYVYVPLQNAFNRSGKGDAVLGKKSSKNQMRREQNCGSLSWCKLGSHDQVGTKFRLKPGSETQIKSQIIASASSLKQEGKKANRLEEEDEENAEKASTTYKYNGIASISPTFPVLRQTGPASLIGCQDAPWLSDGLSAGA